MTILLNNKKIIKNQTCAKNVSFKIKEEKLLRDGMDEGTSFSILFVDSRPSQESNPQFRFDSSRPHEAKEICVTSLTNLMPDF